MRFTLLKSKLIVEIRFRPNLAYFDDMFKIASSIEDGYEDWQASHNPSEGILIDQTNKKSLKITSSSLTLISEDPGYFSKIPEEVHQLYLLFLEPTRINEIKRVGVRRMGIFETNHRYQTLVDGFYDTFYAERDAIKSIAADEVGDVSLIFDGVKDGYKNHVRMGPLKPEQVPAFYQSEFEGKLDLKSETNLFVDVDAFSDVKSTYEGSVKIIDPIIETNQTIHEGLLNLAKARLPE